ncbi:hypothetical protein [Haloarchaeobius sp. HME9146]|uniref:hypothetical protein n=1 Tax=Haloarchaeobius sp. HME9146 TaxID=2978732 RepID=UPI0021BE4867|nr:hypothetical protein [Haloarchaeobius sp. HME9146]MCT9097312.1 hypothetical protein [Haloarchaeobius sp. HME9146]
MSLPLTRFRLGTAALALLLVTSAITPALASSMDDRKRPCGTTLGTPADALPAGTQNASIDVYGVRANVTASDLHTDQFERVEPVPLEGSLVLELRGVRNDTLDEGHSNVDFGWRCLTGVNAGEPTLVHGKSGDVAYLLYDEPAEWEIPGLDENGTAEVWVVYSLPDGRSTDDGKTRLETEVRVERAMVELAGDGPVNAKPTADATLDGWSHFSTDETVTLTLERDGEIVTSENIRVTGDEWRTTVDLSEFDPGTELQWRLTHDGETHSDGTLVVEGIETRTETTGTTVTETPTPPSHTSATWEPTPQTPRGDPVEVKFEDSETRSVPGFGVLPALTALALLGLRRR